MDSFVVSARKYRPAKFNSVVGQNHITNTLKNAILTDHLAQAFLFCGPRGVGKTTCARILAKTINCTNRTENTESCDNCESCKSFNEGASLNISELDAASNNSVDDIRNLVDQVRYAPQLGKFKVYIIDEVHMLSQSAFNAFLKTLEEPPKHAIFILATTEKHKIIPTILSRCQIFDFNRIQIEDIANHLHYIAKCENVMAEPDALHIIAQKADGALRDACSIFDQIVSFSGNNVTYKAAIENLNILDYDYYFKVTDAIIEEHVSSALLLFNEILNNGFDGHNFVAGMGDHLRNLLVSKDQETIQLLEVGNNIKEKYALQSSKFSLSFLIQGLTILNKCDIQYKSSKNHRLQVELALMQLCSINKIGVGNADAEKKNDYPKPAPIQQSITNKKIEDNTSAIKTSNGVAEATPSITVAPQLNTINSAVIGNNVIVNGGNIQKDLGSTIIAVKKPLIKTSSPSINQSFKSVVITEQIKDNSIEQKNNIVNAAKEAFTQQELEATWDKYAEELNAKGRANLSLALLSKRPVLINETIIEFTVNNKALEETINEDKMNFLSFLRRALNNFDIQLNLSVAMLEEKTNLYTATDRFRYLAEKNPAINKLRQAFDLDIEF